MIQRPEKHEYREYFQRYIDLVPEGDLNRIFDDNTEMLTSLFLNMPDTLHEFRYADGKWTPKEMLMHIIDTERVFSYRMLVAARQDTETKLFSMNENAYADNMHITGRSMQSLIEEFAAVRKSTGMLLFNLTDEQTRLLADAITYKVSPRALGYMTVGHAIHHMRILQERYMDKAL